MTNLTGEPTKGIEARHLVLCEEVRTANRDEAERRDAAFQRNDPDDAFTPGRAWMLARRNLKAFYTAHPDMG